MTPKVRRKSKHEQKLADELDEAKATNQRMRRVEQIACRDAARAMALVDAVAHAASAAEALIDAGQPSTAREVLSLVKRMHIDALRDRVSREPGGKHWVYTGTVKIEDGILSGPVGSPAGGQGE